MKIVNNLDVFHSQVAPKYPKLEKSYGCKNTGHFGTGVYFVAGKAGLDILVSSSDRDMKTRPIFSINFQSLKKDYRLFTPPTNEVAFKLHNLFKDIHTAFHQNIWS